MSQPKKIKNALISVFHKDNLEPIVKKLNQLGVTIYSTGGTQKFINDLGIEVEPVEELTSYPSILGGRVKTLHPKVFGGILARRELKEDLEQLAQFEIPEISSQIQKYRSIMSLLTKNLVKTHKSFPIINKLLRNG